MIPVQAVTKWESWVANAGFEGIQLFMLNSSKHAIYHAINVKMPAIIDILNHLLNI